jgi:hypothetical protein
MDDGDDSGEPRKDKRIAPDHEAGTLSRDAERLRELARAQYQAALDRAKEEDAREPNPPNNIETDYRLRDEGRLPEGGLRAFLSDADDGPQTNSWAAARLLARVASAYSLPWTTIDFMAASRAEQLQKLALLLIRDHRPDLFELAPPRPWTNFELRRLARDVAFVRERDRLDSDEHALRVLQSWSIYRKFTLFQLTRRAIEGRKLAGSGRKRGRPRKFAEKRKI